jgi:hypothetical protein
VLRDIVEHDHPIVTILYVTAGTMNTLVSSSGTETSQLHWRLQISPSRQPVFTANNAISAR